jgi:hypothetical protein
MPRTSTYRPKSKSGAAEADWYATPQGRRQTQREFARALKDGTVIRSAGSKIAKTNPKVLQQLMEQARQNATRAISMRIPIADLELARRIADKTGVGYQTVLRAQASHTRGPEEGGLIPKSQRQPPTPAFPAERCTLPFPSFPRANRT